MRYVIVIAIATAFDIGIATVIQALQVFFVFFFQLLTNAGYAMDTSF